MRRLKILLAAPVLALMLTAAERARAHAESEAKRLAEAEQPSRPAEQHAPRAIRQVVDGLLELLGIRLDVGTEAGDQLAVGIARHRADIRLVAHGDARFIAAEFHCGDLGRIDPDQTVFQLFDVGRCFVLNLQLWNDQIRFDFLGQAQHFFPGCRVIRKFTH